MQTTAFEFVPREEVPAFVARLQEESDTMVPPTVPQALSSNEIPTLSLVDGRDEQQQEPPRPTARTRIYLQKTNAQRLFQFEEYTTHGDTKPVSHYQEKPRLLKPTLKSLLKRLHAGEESHSRETGTQAEEHPELLKAVASKLWANKMTLWGARKKIIRDNLFVAELLQIISQCLKRSRWTLFWAVSTTSSGLEKSNP